MSENWHKEYLNQLDMLPMKQLESLFNLQQFSNWPNAEGLNLLRKAESQAPTFKCQSLMEEGELYYEQIIFQDKVIPTRPNSWHDLFNALVWLQFPNTKQLLNQQHVIDIQKVGLSPRSKRRNNLTHFDECGVIITIEKSPSYADTKNVIEQLKQHQWQSVFVDNRALWGQSLNTFMFGHANLEMLLQPFIGLTGKWLAIEVEEGFQQQTYAEQLAEVDNQLYQVINEQDLFSQPKPLKPIPLLGIPGIWDANNNPSFYQNTDYFRPLRLAQ